MEEVGTNAALKVIWLASPGTIIHNSLSEYQELTKGESTDRFSKPCGRVISNRFGGLSLCVFRKKSIVVVVRFSSTCVQKKVPHVRHLNADVRPSSI